MHDRRLIHNTYSLNTADIEIQKTTVIVPTEAPARRCCDPHGFRS